MRVVSVDPANPRERSLAAAVETLSSGGVVALPTETFYGLACDGLDGDALARINRLKGKPEGQPLLLLRWRIAVVSGRPARQVRDLVAVRGVRVFGGHGHEGSWDGTAGRRVAPRTARRLDAIAAGGRQLARTTTGVLIETKPAGVAFHDRNVAPEQLAAWRRERERWLATLDLEDLERLDGRRVVEFRPAGIHKGIVVREMPRGSRGPRPDASLVAIGDDRTDEDMFRELAGLGLGVRVGRPGRSSLADHRLPSPAAVGRFLALLASDVASGG